MTLRISGIHMDIGASFRDRIEARVNEAVAKYFDRSFSGHVTVVKSGSGFSADCVLHLDSGVMLQTSGQAHDPQVAFDTAAERLEKRLRRYNRRRKSRSSPEGASDYPLQTQPFIEATPDEEEDLATDCAPTIVAEKAKLLRRLSVADAVLELDFVDDPLLLFKNNNGGCLNVVYRRSDGNIGWIDLSPGDVNAN